MKIIPAIDILNSAVVRLHRGRFQRSTGYNVTVGDQLRKFEEDGFTQAHIVDLSAARGDTNQRSLIRPHVETCHLSVQLGGGIRSHSDVTECFSFVNSVVVGTVAIEDPSFLSAYTADTDRKRLIIAVDFLDGRLRTRGWMNSSSVDLFSFVESLGERGFTRILCTDISRDGALSGPNVRFYKDLIRRFPAMQVTASGGVRSVNDLNELQQAGMHSVVVGKAYYEGRLSIREMQEFIR